MKHTKEQFQAALDEFKKQTKDVIVWGDHALLKMMFCKQTVDTILEALEQAANPTVEVVTEVQYETQPPSPCSAMDDMPKEIWASSPNTFDGVDLWEDKPSIGTTKYIRADTLHLNDWAQNVMMLKTACTASRNKYEDAFKLGVGAEREWRTYQQAVTILEKAVSYDRVKS